MPEGPTIILTKEAVQLFAGQEIIAVEGSATVDFERLLHQKVRAFKSWGKHFLICFDGFTLRIHFLMFGSYLVNERKTTPLKLRLTFPDGELNLYTCSIKILEGDLNEHYDWSADVISDAWDPEKARAKLKAAPDMLVCDALMDQDIFSGVGNIIKNEVLYRICLHPESALGKIPAAKIGELLEEARNYSFDFLEWKRHNELKKHWLAHNQKVCRRCNLSFQKNYTGEKKRRSFFCTNCQILYE